MNKESNSLRNVKYPDAIKLSCPRCGNSAALKIGQVNFRGQLRWFESVNCDKCGLRSEVDGVGFPSSKLHEMLIQSDGEWVVAMKEVNSTASVVKVLRSALLLDMKVALALLKTESKVIFRGTRSESLWLGQLLEEAGELPELHMLG
jgi:hypothetical protein